MTTRRSFLRTLGLATTGAVLVGPDVIEAFARLTHVRKSFPSASLAPKLWGDGIHDDSAALQYYIDEAARTGGSLNLTGGTYRVTGSTVVLREGTFIASAHFDGAGRTHGGPLFSIPSPQPRHYGLTMSSFVA